MFHYGSLKNMKKIISVLLIISMMIFAGACSKNADNGDTSSAETAQNATSDAGYSDEFSDGDYKALSASDAEAIITLSGSEGSISDTTRGSSGSIVTITSKGTYLVEGSSSGVQIYVNDETESGNIYLLLSGISMENDSACIYVEAADKVIVQCTGENSIKSVNEAAVYSKDDLTLNGDGSLTVTSDGDGIHCSDDLIITGADIKVDAGDIGIDAGDSVKIGGGATEVDSGHDGVQIANDEADGYFYMESGSLTLNAGYDGIDAAGGVTLAGGTLDITSGGGSGISKDGSVSQKGIKCDGEISVSLEAEINISSADDAVHCSSLVNIFGGTLSLSSSDDGLHADGELNISGGVLIITKSYEGIEAETVNISGGTVGVNSSDDGINAAGGSDSASNESDLWEDEAVGKLNISGGNIYVNCSGDGLDSNGTINVSGGAVIIEGPTGSDNATGMAVNFNAGTQCSALVSLTGSEGDVITVDDGSGFSYTATKSFQCAVYSSPALEQGSAYTITAGSSSAEIDFSGGLYYSAVN